MLIKEMISSELQRKYYSMRHIDKQIEKGPNMSYFFKYNKKLRRGQEVYIIKQSWPRYGLG